jgi:hypothetical protein
MGHIFKNLASKMTQAYKTISLDFIVRGEKLEKTVQKSIRIPVDATPSVLEMIVRKTREGMADEYKKSKLIDVNVYPVSKLLQYEFSH